MVRTKEWHDDREPPENLVALVTDQNRLKRGDVDYFDDIANYVNQVSFDLFEKLTADDNPRVRCSAALHLVELFDSGLFVKYELGVVGVIMRLLKDPVELVRCKAAELSSGFIRHPSILQSLLSALKWEKSQNRRIDINQESADPANYITQALEKVGLDSDEDIGEYVVRRIVQMGLLTAFSRPRFIKYGLRALVKFNPILALDYIKVYLTEECLTDRDFGRGSMGMKNKKRIKMISSRFTSSILVNLSVSQLLCHKRTISIIISSLIDIEKSAGGFSPTQQSIQDDLFRIATNNPLALSRRVVGKEVYEKMPIKVKSWF